MASTIRSQSSGVRPSTRRGGRSGKRAPLASACANDPSCERSIRGGMNRPRLAIVAATAASCRGVTSKSPWPMAMFTVSPGYHISPLLAIFQSLSGRTPGSASATSNAVAWP